MDGSDSPTERFRENIVGITSMLVTGLWMAAMFTGQGWWLPALLVGYIVVIPLVSILFGDEEDTSEWVDQGRSPPQTTAPREETRDDAESTDAALQKLRERYARGELTETQFEHKLERLLEVETVEELERTVESSDLDDSVNADGSSDLQSTAESTDHPEETETTEQSTAGEEPAEADRVLESETEQS